MSPPRFRVLQEAEANQPIGADELVRIAGANGAGRGHTIGWLSRHGLVIVTASGFVCVTKKGRAALAAEERNRAYRND